MKNKYVVCEEKQLTISLLAGNTNYFTNFIRTVHDEVNSFRDFFDMIIASDRDN
jgi:hypothetical protein